MTHTTRMTQHEESREVIGEERVGGQGTRRGRGREGEGVRRRG